MGKTLDNAERVLASAFKIADAKFGDIDEWVVFRAAFLGRDAAGLVVPADIAEDIEEQRPARKRRKFKTPSYADLGVEAVAKSGIPLPTPLMLEYIGRVRQMAPEEVERSRISIQTSFSKDPRLVSIKWAGGSGKSWWFAGREVPPTTVALEARGRA